MPDNTQPAIQRLQVDLDATIAILGKKAYSRLDGQNELILTLDRIQESVMELRELDFSSQLFDFYKNNLVPALLDLFRKPDDWLNREPIKWHLYNTISCITGLFADNMDREIDAVSRGQSLLVIDRISILVHDYRLLDWSKEYALAIKNDLEHIVITGQNIRIYKDYALVRQKMVALLMSPTAENAEELILILNKAVNKRIFIDILKGETNESAYLQLVSLMRHCMQNIKAGTVAHQVNSAYAKLLLKILKHEPHQWELYCELQKTQTNENGIEPKIADKVKKYIDAYKRRPGNGWTNDLKRLVRTSADHIGKADRNFELMRFRAHQPSVTSVSIFAVNAAAEPKNVISRSRLRRH